MLHFAFRNLLLFFKDKAAVLLSFLAEFIIVGLYILFIKDNLIQSFEQVKDAALLMDVWMIAGVLGVTSVTTTMGAYGVMVDDRAGKIDRDFLISPIRKFSILGGYMTAAIGIGIFLSIFILLLSQAYVLHCYGVKFGTDTMVWAYAILVLTTISNSSLVLLLVSFLKSSNALASCCTILGALIGFLTGIYLPMGTLPEEVQWLVKCFPVSHGVALFRQVLMETLLERSFGGAETLPAMQFAEYMGIRYVVDGSYVSAKHSALFLIASTVVCLSTAIYIDSKLRE